jgi:murein DD-endopeptidase MepM/ murein hydrolase activator NlpD
MTLAGPGGLSLTPPLTVRRTVPVTPTTAVNGYSDYFSFGCNINSVADGEVITVINGVPDNQPGIVNPHSYSGNTVIIRHSKFEYSVYIHLMNNSIVVKPKDKVSSGQLIAKCGNSGTSLNPHLHFQMMNSETPAIATGFLAYFSNVLVRSKNGFSIVNDYLPNKSDVVVGN